MTDPTATAPAARRAGGCIVVTLGLVALLVIGIGAATAFVGLRALDADVDRALAASVDAAVARGLDGELPPAEEEAERGRDLPASSDTFVLVLDPTGSGRRQPVPAGARRACPDTLGARRRVGRRAATSGRSTWAAPTVRLLTVPISLGGRARRIGYVQGGFVLTLHDDQSHSLVAAIALVGVVGLDRRGGRHARRHRRALVPIRQSFDAQRRFVADASHELRTPAALIRANAEVLEREGLVTDDGRPLVDDIVAEADRLGRLVGDLLAARVVGCDRPGPRPPAGRPRRGRRRHRAPGGRPWPPSAA